MTNSTGLLRVVIVWPGRRFSVDVPCCDDCSLAVTRQRRLRGAVTWIAIVAAVVLALEFLDDLPRHARKWAVMGLVLAGVSPLIGWQVFFPPIVDITAHSDRVDYEFKDARYAAEFASLNGSTIDG